jgi:hypothetical protein
MPGKTYGIDAFAVTQELCDRWRKLYELAGDRSEAPLGIITLIQQQAFNTVMSPRTPGNVQAAQEFDVKGRPAIGSTVYTEVTCLSKEVRRERHWVRLEFRCRRPDGTMLFGGRNLIVVPY